MKLYELEIYTDDAGWLFAVPIADFCSAVNWYQGKLVSVHFRFGHVCVSSIHAYASSFF